MVYSYYRNKIDKPIWGCAITPTAMIQTFVCPKSSFCADYFHLPCSRPSSPRMVEFYRLLGVCAVCGLTFHEFGVQVILGGDDGSVSLVIIYIHMDQSACLSSNLAPIQPLQ